MSSKVLISTVGIGNRFKPFWPGEPPQSHLSGSLHAGATRELIIEGGTPIPRQMMPNFTELKVTKIVAYALITYDDNFGKFHKTEACVVWEGGARVFSCPDGYNTAD